MTSQIRSRMEFDHHWKSRFSEKVSLSQAVLLQPLLETYCIHCYLHSCGFAGTSFQEIKIEFLLFIPIPPNGNEDREEQHEGTGEDGHKIIILGRFGHGSSVCPLLNHL